MPDEETQNQDTETTENAPHAEQASQQTVIDDLWNQLSEEDKIGVWQDANDHRRAVVGIEDLINKLAPAQKAEAEKKIEAEKKAPQSDDPIQQVLERFERLEQRIDEKDKKEQADREAKQKQDEAKKAEADFYGTINSVLDEDEDFAKDEDMRVHLIEAYSGHWLKHQPRDIQRSAKEYIKRFKETSSKRSSKDRQNYVQGKINDARATRGESGGGTSPGKNEWQPTVEEFDNGTMDDRVKALMGL